LPDEPAVELVTGAVPVAEQIASMLRAVTVDVINAEHVVRSAAGACLAVVSEDAISPGLLDSLRTFAASALFLFQVHVAICGVDLPLALAAVVAAPVWSARIRPELAERLDLLALTAALGGGTAHS